VFTEGEPCPNRPAPDTHNVIKYSGVVTSLREICGPGDSGDGDREKEEGMVFRDLSVLW